MRKIMIVAAMLTALSTAAAAQVPVDSDNRVGQPGATKGTGPGKSGFFDTYEQGTGIVKSPRGASGSPTGIQSPRDAASGLPTGVQASRSTTSQGDQPELQRRLQSPRDPASGLPTGKH